MSQAKSTQMQRKTSIFLVFASTAVALSACSQGDTVQLREVRLAQEPVSGAIFTTLVDGSSVNANMYDAKEDVYLDGGPGPNAPITSAGLPEGDYFFQVTDPSGKDLLSVDHISCRRVHVNAQGVISEVFPGTTYQKVRGQMVAMSCMHRSGTDMDHDAVTVQLMPYDDTPNRGGVYKVWMTPVGHYAGDPALVPLGPSMPVNGERWQPANVHGFIPSQSKTDNYKVRTRGPQKPPSMILVEKFHDRDFDGMLDDGESLISGWEVLMTDPVGSTNLLYTSAEVMVHAGLFSFLEEVPAGTMQTVSLMDGMMQSLIPDADPRLDVLVLSDHSEMHRVLFGNVALGSVKTCKVFDRNANGIEDAGEPRVPGWPMSLTGVQEDGVEVGPIQLSTQEDGCVTFGGLLPGTYMVTEGSGGIDWMPTGASSSTHVLTSHLEGSLLVGDQHLTHFTNLCLNEADFGTKGYWHNKNGLAEIEPFMIDFVNSLSPYLSSSSYFGAGDEPFDGFFMSGSPVSAASGAWGELLAPEGSSLAEVSHFLVDANASGDHREQLAQQLLAFIFNTRYRLMDFGSLILLDGELVSASEIITDAIAAWMGTDALVQTKMKDILDGLNNDDAVQFVPADPCPVNSL